MTRKIIKDALDAIMANHQHHHDYDDYDGYVGSDLHVMNLKIISELQNELKVVLAPEPVKVSYDDAIALGRIDHAHSECPEDCRGCEHFKTCVYPVMT